MGDTQWIKAIGKKLREDLGDCPTLPPELLDALGKLEAAAEIKEKNAKPQADGVKRTGSVRPR